MTRSGVRTFLETGVNTVNPQLAFGYGRLSEWNSKRDNQYPGVWWETRPTSTEIVNVVMPFDSYDVQLHIGKQDAIDSIPIQYEMIIDACDQIARELIKYYNDQVSGYDTITIESITRTPFIKKHSDIITGVILAFTLTGPDTQEIC